MGQVGYVYIVHGKGTNYVKVGKTSNVLKRLQKLQQGVPFPLCLLSVTLVEDMDIAEQGLKDTYRPYGIRGEWYALPDELLRQWPNDGDMAPLTQEPIREPLQISEGFSSLTAMQIKALLQDRKTMTVTSCYEALEAHTQKARTRIRVCLSRLCAGGMIARDFRGMYILKRTVEIVDSEVTANDVLL